MFVGLRSLMVGLMDRAGEGAAGGSDDDGGTGGTGGGASGGEVDSGGGTAGAGGAGAGDNIHTLTHEQFKERMERANAKQLKKLFGTSNVDELTQRFKRLSELESAEEERKRQEMTEMERHKADLEAEKAARAKTEEELAEVKFDAHVSGICASLGVKNIDYAKFIVGKKASALPDGEELDVREYLEERLGDDKYQAALGIASEAVEVEAPVSNSPNPGQAPPPPPPPAGGGGGKKNPKDMSASEFREHLASLGVGTAGH